MSDNDRTRPYMPEQRIYPPDWEWACGMIGCRHAEPVLTSMPPPDLPHCPQCGATMVRRRLQRTEA